jgi:valyl-tRNA synthetase
LVYIKEQIDTSAAIARLEKAIAKDQKVLEGIQAKLSKPAFLENAAVEAIEKERLKQSDMERQIAKMQSYIQDLSSS